MRSIKERVVVDVGNCKEKTIREGTIAYSNDGVVYYTGKGWREVTESFEATKEIEYLKDFLVGKKLLEEYLLWRKKGGERR